jgi:hypothetical protein
MYQFALVESKIAYLLCPGESLAGMEVKCVGDHVCVSVNQPPTRADAIAAHPFVHGVPHSVSYTEAEKFVFRPATPPASSLLTTAMETPFSPQCLRLSISSTEEEGSKECVGEEPIIEEEVD